MPPFENVFLKPFPVRAVIDVGTGGFASLAVGRVDAQRRAIQSLMHHQRLPVVSSADPVVRSRRVVSPAATQDVLTQLRLLRGVTHRAELKGISEVRIVLSHPYCACENIDDVAVSLEKELAMGDVYVLQENGGLRRPAAVGGTTSHPFELDTVEDALGRLAFEAAAAASRCVVRHRMLCIEEADESMGSLAICGWDHTPLLQQTHRQTANGDAGDNRVGPSEVDVLRMEEDAFRAAWDVHHGAPTPPSLLRHVLPLSAADVHRMLLVHVQKREPLQRGAQLDFRSPNPVTRHEFTHLVSLVERVLLSTLPQWVKAKSASGGVICGTSSNGGTLNIAARVSGQQNASLDHLETASEHHFCGLTDVLLGHNFPQPAMVLTQAAFAAALMRALKTPRVHYLPEVSLAMGALVAPQLWSFDKADTLKQHLGRRKWFASQRQRVFERPRNSEFRGQSTATSAKITSTDRWSSTTSFD